MHSFVDMQPLFPCSVHPRSQQWLLRAITAADMKLHLTLTFVLTFTSLVDYLSRSWYPDSVHLFWLLYNYDHLIYIDSITMQSSSEWEVNDCWGMTALNSEWKMKVMKMWVKPRLLKMWLFTSDIMLYSCLDYYDNHIRWRKCYHIHSSILCLWNKST